MNGKEISEYLKCDKFTKTYFRGVLPYDKLKNSTLIKPGLYIVNTDVSTGPGLHWVCIMLQNEIEYFDSLGNEPKEVKPFLQHQNKPYTYSTKRIQGYDSDVCGDYCILFAYFRCRGMMLNEFVNLFTDDVLKNDVLVEL